MMRSDMIWMFLICFLSLVASEPIVNDEAVCAKDEAACDDVAVVGAGVAGSYVAYRLRARNLTITLYELSNRIGGRLYTVRLPKAKDVLVELGDSRLLPEVHMQTLLLAEKLGLESRDLTEGDGGGPQMRFFLRGVSLGLADLMTSRLPYNFSDKDSLDVVETARRMLVNLTGQSDITQETAMTLPLLTGGYLYQISVEEALRRALSAELRAFWEATFAFSPTTLASSSSRLFLMLLDTRLGGSQTLTLKAGMQALPEAMVKVFKGANPARNKLELNARLVGVSLREGGGYDLSFLQSTSQLGATRDTGVAMRRCANRVVLALPRLALGALAFGWGGASCHVEEGMSSTRDVAMVKAFLAYPRPWWRNTPHRAALTTSDLHFRRAFDVGESRDGHAVLAAVLTESSDLNFWRHLQWQGSPIAQSPHGELRVSTAALQEMTKELAKAFGVDPSSIPQPLSGLMLFWEGWPYGGAWTVWQPGANWTAICRRMLRPDPEEDVFVVGRSFITDPLASDLEGALQSASQVLEEYF